MANIVECFLYSLFTTLPCYTAFFAVPIGLMDNERRVEFCVVSGVLKGGENPDSPLNSLPNSTTSGAGGLGVQFPDSQGQSQFASLEHSLASPATKAAAIKTEADEAA